MGRHRMSDIYDEESSSGTAPPSIDLSEWNPPPYTNDFIQKKTVSPLLVENHVFTLLLILAIGMVLNLWQMFADLGNETELSVRVLFWPFFFFIGVVLMAFIMRYETSRFQLAGYIYFLQKINWFWKIPFLLHAWNFAVVSVLFACTSDDHSSKLPYMSDEAKETVIILIWVLTHIIQAVCWTFLAKTIYDHNRRKPQPDSTLSVHLVKELDSSDPINVIKQQDETIRLLEKQVDSTEREMKRLETQREEETKKEEMKLKEQIELRKEEIVVLEREKEQLRVKMDNIRDELTEETNRLSKSSLSILS